jgi:hypothetical protein
MRLTLFYLALAFLNCALGIVLMSTQWPTGGMAFFTAGVLYYLAIDAWRQK